MTIILSPLEFEHLVQVVRDASGGDRAECLCGWASRWTDDLATADNAASSHRRQIDQVSCTDSTIATLLDLQDDLADAIMWLAECWPPDLPALRARSCTDDLHGSDGRPGLALEAECESPSEMARLACLLGGPRVGDLEPDSAGHRYERSVRRFGQVHIVALHAVDRA